MSIELNNIKRNEIKQPSLDDWSKKDFINKFHSIPTRVGFEESNMPEGFEFVPECSSFHYRNNGQFNDAIEEFVFPNIENELRYGNPVFFCIPKDQLSKKDGVYYAIRKKLD